jgi:hypothetical protein
MSELCCTQIKQVSPADASRWTYNSLPVNFQNLWKAMLNFLHQNRVIPLLVEKLIRLSSSENMRSGHREMVAVWVKELLESVDKGKKTRIDAEMGDTRAWKQGGKENKVDKTEKLRLKTKLKTICTASHIHKEIVQEAEKQNPHL